MADLFTYLQRNEEQFRKARVASLYSDFRLLRITNPDGYAANIAAWETALAHAVEAGRVPGGHDILSLGTGPELLRALETKEWGRPLALGAVIDEAIAQGHMVPLETFLRSPKSIYERSWTINPFSLLSWGLQQLGLAKARSEHDSLRVGQFVIIRNLEAASRNVLDSLESRERRADRIFPLKMFRKLATESLGLATGLTNRDLSILLVHLSRDKKQIAYNAQVVKFRSARDENLSISTIDTSIASLKSLIMDLNLQVDSLSTKVDDFSGKARIAVAQKNRVSALSNLRSRRLHEGLLESRSATLSQLEDLYVKIEEAADQVETVRVMQESSKALRGIYAELGGLDTVEDVIEGLRNEMIKVDEINSIIGQAEQNSTLMDEDAIDDELVTLEKEQSVRFEQQEALKVKERLEAIRTSTSSERLYGPDHDTLSLREKPDRETQRPELEVNLEVSDESTVGLDKTPHNQIRVAE
ncbi:MAG: hypothetical protein Q9187_002658 [Circinaria calcarea]